MLCLGTRSLTHVWSIADFEFRTIDGRYICQNVCDFFGADPGRGLALGLKTGRRAMTQKDRKD